MRRIALTAFLVSLVACGGDPEPTPPAVLPAIEPGSAAARSWVENNFADGWFPDDVVEESEVAYEDGPPAATADIREEGGDFGPAREGVPAPRPSPRPPGSERDRGLSSGGGERNRGPFTGGTGEDFEVEEENPRFGGVVEDPVIRDARIADDSDGRSGRPGDDQRPDAQESWQSSKQKPNASRLMVGDDASLPLESFQATARIDGHRARVVLDLCYRNTLDFDAEGIFKLRLPDEASVHHLAFGDVVEQAPLLLPGPGRTPFDLSPAALTSARAGGTVQRTARVVPRERAQQAYAAETAQAVDPALLEWAGAGVFTTRVFPLLQGRTSRITVAYDVELEEAGGERIFRLDVPEDAGDSRVAVQWHGSRLVEPGREGTPLFADGASMVTDGFEGPLMLRLAGPLTSPLVGDDPAIGPHFSVNVAPDVPAAQSTPRRRAVFLLDASMSSNPDRMNVWRDLLHAVLEQNRADISEFAVLFFNVETWWWRDGFAPNDDATVRALLADIERIALEGGTDLGAALAAVAAPAWTRGALDADTFLLSDGAESWGAAPAEGVAASLDAPVYCYTTGLPGTDVRGLRALARTTGGAVFSVGGRSNIAAAATAHRARPWMIREIRVAGCEDVLAAGRPSTIYPGQTLRLGGRGRPRAGDDVVITVEQDGRTQNLSVALGAPIESPLAPRAYGEIATGQLEELREIAAVEARAYALHYRVTGPTCSLLMLETEEDYQEYGIVPTADAEVVRQRPVSTVTSELTTEMEQARSDPRAAFLLWLDRLDRLSEDAFDDLDALRDAARSLPVSAFTIQPRAISCTSRTWDQIDSEFVASLLAADPVYDAALAEASRRFEDGRPGDALRALSSLIEADPGSTDLLRDVAFTALDWDTPHAAYGLLRRVADQRPHEPETYRGLAECLERMGHADLAILMYEIALRGKWDGRFGAFTLITAMDYRGLLRRIERGEVESSLTDLADQARESIAKDYVSGDADLVVTMTWNTDRTDVDLHVTDPSEETCYYGHARTRLGGAITADVTQGYGPEMFVLGRAAEGEYIVKAHYYGSDRLRKTLRSRVFVTITRHFGRPNETRVRRAFVLEKQGEAYEVMRLTWE